MWEFWGKKWQHMYPVFDLWYFYILEFVTLTQSKSTNRSLIYHSYFKMSLNTV